MGSSKRMLVVTGDFPVASETFIIAHIRGMIERGWHVCVCAGTINRPEVTRLFGATAPETHAIDERASKFRARFKFRQRGALGKCFGASWESQFPTSGGPRMFARAHELAAIAREFNPDVIHCEFGFQAPFAGPVAHALGVPMLVVFRGNDFIRFPIEHGWQIYARMPIKSVAIAHSDFCERILKRNLKVPVARVRRGVNRANFRPPARAEGWGATVRLVVVGRLRFFKGHHLALEALALLRKMMPQREFTLTLVGGGDPADTLWRKAEILGLREQVKLTGMLDPAGVSEHMRQADIQLIPSQAGAAGFVENFCTVASEGLASGLPAVASNHGGIPETVRDNGVLVPAGSAHEIARGVIALLQSNTPAGWAAKTQADSQRFQDEQMMDDFEKVTKEAIEGTPWMQP